MHQTLRPEPGERGLASTQPSEVSDLVCGAWDAMAQLARRLPLDSPSRCPGWRVHDVLAHLGAWDDHPVFTSLLEDARAGRVHEIQDVDQRNARLVHAHRDAGRQELVGALERARDRAAVFLGSAEALALGTAWSHSPVGPLPVTGVLVASAYELAVHALDVAEPDQVPSPLLAAGVGALVDTTGALAARAGVSTQFAVRTPIGAWAAGTTGADWTTLALQQTPPADAVRWPTIEGTAADVLDATAGRRPALAMVATRRLRLHDLPGLLVLLPALEDVVSLPGGTALRAASRALGRTTTVLGRLGHLAPGR